MVHTGGTSRRQQARPWASAARWQGGRPSCLRWTRLQWSVRGRSRRALHPPVFQRDSVGQMREGTAGWQRPAKGRTVGPQECGEHRQERAVAHLPGERQKDRVIRRTRERTSHCSGDPALSRRAAAIDCAPLCQPGHHRTETPCQVPAARSPHSEEPAHSAWQLLNRRAPPSYSSHNTATQRDQAAARGRPMSVAVVVVVVVCHLRGRRKVW